MWILVLTPGSIIYICVSVAVLHQLVEIGPLILWQGSRRWILAMHLLPSCGCALSSASGVQATVWKREKLFLNSFVVLSNICSIIKHFNITLYFLHFLVFGARHGARIRIIIKRRRKEETQRRTKHDKLIGDSAECGYWSSWTII